MPNGRSIKLVLIYRLVQSDHCLVPYIALNNLQVSQPIGNFITDKSIGLWISGNYTALGGEKNLIIGKFLQ